MKCTVLHNLCKKILSREQLLKEIILSIFLLGNFGKYLAIKMNTYYLLLLLLNFNLWIYVHSRNIFWTFHHCYSIHSLDSKKARIQYVHTRSVNIPSDPKYSKIVKNRKLCEYEGPSLRVALF